MKTTPIIFLDFDGVLTSTRVCEAVNEAFWSTPDPIACKLIVKLINEFGCKLVISSTWRLLYHKNSIEMYLRSHGFPDGILHADWGTKELGVRSEEIKEWISRHPEATVFVAIDDDTLNMPEWVATDGDEGFLYKHYYAARRILSKRLQSTYDQPWGTVL